MLHFTWVLAQILSSAHVGKDSTGPEKAVPEELRAGKSSEVTESTIYYGTMASHLTVFSSVKWE